MLYLAIDQHARHLTVQLRDEPGEVVVRRQVSTRWEPVQAFFARLQEESQDAGGFVAALEVCGFNHWLIKLLGEYGCGQIILVQPEKKGRQKTDRRDANSIGELLWVNRHRLLAGKRVQGLRQIHIASDQDEEARRLTALRQRVGQELGRTISQIKHLLRRHNLQQECPTKGIKTERARAWLKRLSLGELDRMEMDHLLSRLGLLEDYRLRLEQQIQRCQERHRASIVLRTIPGAGAYTALGLACRVGPLERFPRPASLANYWGLAPGINDSGEATGRIGSITKRGSPTARFLLGQLITHVLHKDPAQRDWYRKVRRRRGSRVARVGAMRRLTTIIWRMLKTGEAYQLSTPAAASSQVRTVASR